MPHALQVHFPPQDFVFKKTVTPFVLFSLSEVRTQFTCFTGKKVQRLTPEALLSRRTSNPLSKSKVSGVEQAIFFSVFFLTTTCSFSLWAAARRIRSQKSNTLEGSRQKNQNTDIERVWGHVYRFSLSEPPGFKVSGGEQASLRTHIDIASMKTPMYEYEDTYSFSLSELSHVESALSY